MNFEFWDFCTDVCQILKNFGEPNYDFSWIMLGFFDRGAAFEYL